MTKSTICLLIGCTVLAACKADPPKIQMPDQPAAAAHQAQRQLNAEAGDPDPAPRILPDGRRDKSVFRDEAPLKRKAVGKASITRGVIETAVSQYFAGSTISKQVIQLRDFAWLEAHLQHADREFTSDSRVWVAELEGDLVWNLTEAEAETKPSGKRAVIAFSIENTSVVAAALSPK